MTSRRLLGLSIFVAAALVGGFVGLSARPKGDRGPGRPPAVEDVLRAVDRGDAAALERALEIAGAPTSHALPWRDELTFAKFVLARDVNALWKFATEGPKNAARARALLWLRESATTVDESQRYEARLETDYPASWAIRPELLRKEGPPK